MRSENSGLQTAGRRQPCAKAVRKSPKKAVQKSVMQDAIIDAMEQGVLVWGLNEKCIFFNDRLHSILELSETDLKIGMDRKEFVRRCESRRERTTKSAAEITEATLRGESFSFDRILKSGRTVAITARPLQDGGHVVTFTDVTEARKLVFELEAAKQVAELAEAQTKEALASEKLRQQQVHMLAKLGEWLQSCKTLDELYDVVSAHLLRMLPDTSGELYIYSNSRDVLDGVCSWNGTTALDHIHADDCWSLRRGRSYIFGSGEVDFVCGHVAEQEWDSEGKGFFCIPIIAHGDTVGLLHIKVPKENPGEQSRRFSSLNDKRSLAIQCAEQISLAVANVKLRDQLRDQSVRDPLTGLYNRRYVLEALRSEIGRSRKKTKPLSVISFDADHFKRFNDNHGHDAGDAVLRTLGELLPNIFDTDEINCRFGGEEFLVVLPETDETAACVRAEELRSAVEALKIRYGDHYLPTATISIGVAALSENCSDPQSLLHAADLALYRAKSAGRNRVCV